MSSYKTTLGVFFYQFIFFCILVAILLIRRRTSKSQFGYLTLSFLSFAFFVWQCFGSIGVGKRTSDTMLHLDFSLTPFKSFGYLFSDQQFIFMRNQLLVGYLAIILFSVIFGFCMPKCINYFSKKAFILYGCFGIAFIELMLGINFWFIYVADIILNGFFDTGMFILAPVFFIFGLFIQYIVYKKTKNKVRKRRHKSEKRLNTND